MRLRVGTSGFSYAGWKGRFYPARIPAREMLGYYAQQLESVEINQTFYRLPRLEQMTGWAQQVPADFRFAIKTPRRITHFKRLRDAREETEYLLQTLAALGAHMGVLLVQLPPGFGFDRERLLEFVDLLGERWPVAFEFRHASWGGEGAPALLAERGIGTVGTDVETPQPELCAASRVGYLRLRRETYRPEELDAWAVRLAEQTWAEGYVFFKHEVEGPARALALAHAFARQQPR